MARGLALAITILALGGAGLAVVKPWGWPRGDQMRLQNEQAAVERATLDRTVLEVRAELARAEAAKAEAERLAAMDREEAARKLTDLESHIKGVMARAVDADRALAAAQAASAQEIAVAKGVTDEVRKELARVVAARAQEIAVAKGMTDEVRKELARVVAARDDLAMRLASTQMESERAIAEAREAAARARADQPGAATAADFETRLATVRTEAAERFMAARNEADRQITAAQADAARCRAELEQAVAPAEPAPTCLPAPAAAAEPVPGDTPTPVAEIAQQLQTTGHIALYIPFDTGSAVIKPNAYPSIEPIAAALRQDPKLKLLLVGHTDSQGDFGFHRTLSENRAKAIVDLLISKHGIERARLSYAGVADLAPIAGNETDAGRQRNRRIELVRR